jgi:lipid A 3-O-deacylase
MIRISAKIFSLLFLCLITTVSFAWERSVELGYGYSHDSNNTNYNNSGFLLSSDVWPVWRNDLTYWTINGALGQWHTTAPTNNDVTTAAVALALRLYPLCNNMSAYPFYLLGSAGPAYLSHKQYGNNKQGSNLAFQLFAGLGVELNNQWDVNLRAMHYSNGGTSSPNQGYNILYLLSLGYLF